MLRRTVRLSSYFSAGFVEADALPLGIVAETIYRACALLVYANRTFRRL